jgi:hypothetical protein
MSESKKIHLNIQAVLDALNNPANAGLHPVEVAQKVLVPEAQVRDTGAAQRHSHSNRSARRESFRRANSNMGGSR